jgi:hypothetical protein
LQHLAADVVSTAAAPIVLSGVVTGRGPPTVKYAG